MVFILLQAKIYTNKHLTVFLFIGCKDAWAPQQAAGLLIINWNDADILASSTREQHRGTFYGEVCLCRSAVRWDRNKWRPHLGPASQKKEACDMEAHTQPNSIQMVWHRIHLAMEIQITKTKM